jgi:hypothetical protein
MIKKIEFQGPIVSNVTYLKILTITRRIPNSCVGQQLYGVRYLWHETPYRFKQAAIYSDTDPNLSSPYIKFFKIIPLNYICFF